MLKNIKLGFYSFMFMWHARRALAAQKKSLRCLQHAGIHINKNTEYLKKITELSDHSFKKEA